MAQGRRAISTTKTLVVVLGHYGAERKHVEKYAQIWRQQIRGMDKVITSPCSGSPLVFFTAGVFNALHVYREMCAVSTNGTTDVIIHALSNGGMLVYLSLVNLIIPYYEQGRGQQRFNVRGVVFDSCPGSLSPAMFLRATLANQTATWKRCAVYLAPMLLMLAMFKRCGLYGTLIRLGVMGGMGQVATLSYQYVACKVDRNRSASLFLYSDADEIVSSQEVERAITTRRAYIGQVQSKKWADSAHVKHLLDHEKDYVNELRAFTKCSSGRMSAL